MKKLIFSSLVGLALVTFTGCANSNETTVSKCQSGKCDGAKKCDGTSKCGDTKKCAATEKCGK